MGESMQAKAVWSVKTITIAAIPAITKNQHKMFKLKYKRATFVPANAAIVSHVKKTMIMKSTHFHYVKREKKTTAYTTHIAAATTKASRTGCEN